MPTGRFQRAEGIMLLSEGEYIYIPEIPEDKFSWPGWVPEMDDLVRRPLRIEGHWQSGRDPTCYWIKSTVSSTADWYILPAWCIRYCGPIHQDNSR